MILSAPVWEAVWGLGLLTLGTYYFFFCGERTFSTLSLGIICPAPEKTLGTTIFSANPKSGTTLFLFSRASYPSPLDPQLVSKYFLNHWIN